MELIKLFVVGFPLEIDELELAKLFAPNGDISTIRSFVIRKRVSEKGYAFMEMNDRKGAEAAAESLDGADMKGSNSQ